MGRISVNELRTFGPSRQATDRFSDIADVFLPQIRESLRPETLRGRFGETLTVDDTALYVTNRHWKMGAAKPPGEFSYEQCFHNCYWPAPDNGHYPLIIVKGKEGVGKSTFLRFYFDCYLRHYRQFLKGSSEEDVCLHNWRQSDIKKHIILYVDLHPPASFEEARDRIYAQFRRTIYEYFPKISVDQDYAMWRRLARWDEPARRKAEKACSGKVDYRTRWVDSHLDHNREFVREALWYLSTQMDKKGCRRHYITQIFDNIDQLDVDIQKKLLEEIFGWLKHDTCQWRVIVPLRPETLRQIRRFVGPIAGRETIELGDVDYADFVRRRQIDLEFQITGSGKQIERNRFVREHKTIVFQPISNFLVVEYLRRILNVQFPPGSGQIASARPLTVEILTKFCNSSLRRLLRVLMRVLISTPLQRAAEQEDGHEKKGLSHYVFLSGWLVGDRDYFNEEDEDNDVVNLFHAPAIEPSAYGLLVGVHVAHFLSKSDILSRSQVLDTFTQIGYQRDEIDKCLDTFLEKGLFKREVLPKSGDYRIYVESDVVEAHLRLVREPAYVDNMALVTPVREDFARMRMSHTVPYAIGEFRDRVITTFHFLQQIRDDEILVGTWRNDSPRHGMKRDDFVNAFNQLNLPSIYKRCAVAYRGRLQGLKESATTLGEVMTEHSWSTLLRHQILAVDSAEADKPLIALSRESGGE